MSDTVSHLTGGSNSFQTTSELLNAPITDLFSDGVVGAFTNTGGVAPATGALAVNAQGSPNMTVAITGGVCYGTATPTSQGSQRLRAKIASQNATIASNSTGSTRHDYIYVKLDPAGAANPNVDGTGVATIVVSRSTSPAVDNGTPPTYGLLIARVLVVNSIVSVTNAVITDMRTVVGVAASSTADGWVSAGETWTYASATTFTISGDSSTRYSPGDKIRLSQSTTKYFYITGVAFSAGTTTITINGGTDYVLTNATISSNYFSKATSPNGFPQHFNFTTTHGGYSVVPSGGKNRFSMAGRTVEVRASDTGGTSNATTTTYVLPVTSANQGDQVIGVGVGVNNGSAVWSNGTVTANSTTLSWFNQGTTWTNSGTKYVIFTIRYEI